jgi:hypothetical protein
MLGDGRPAKSPDGMTNLEVRETIIRDIAGVLKSSDLMDIWGQAPRIVGTYSTPGGDVWLELDYGKGHTYHLSLRRYTHRTLMYAQPIQLAT